MIMHYLRLQIAKHKARKTFRRYNNWYTPETLPEYLKNCFCGREGELGIYRKTKKFCSDPACCGNPRRLKGMREGGLTRQELKAN